ncbi:aldo/keto reductase [Streptomyces sp. NPDC002623]
MQYRTLGTSGLAVSKLAFGTMNFGTENTEEESLALLDAFIEAGGNMIDTSDVYGGGLSEQIIGRWLAARPREITDRVVLTTKGRFTTGPDVNTRGLSRRHLTRALDASLRRIAEETGATPAQVALSWIADRPGVVAPIFGARTLKQLHDGFGAVALTLDAEATAALDKVSAPTPGGYPYGAFGTSQRDRRLQGGAQALGDLIGNGSDHPTGRL